MSQLLQLITQPYPDYLPNLDHKKPLVVLWYYQKDVMLRNGQFRKKVLPHNQLRFTLRSLPGLAGLRHLAVGPALDSQQVIQLR